MVQKLTKQNLYHFFLTGPVGTAFAGSQTNQTINLHQAGQEGGGLRRRVREMEDGRRKGRSEEGSEGKRPPRVEVKLQEWIREDLGKNSQVNN